MSSQESMPFVPEKQCSRCKQVFPATIEYFLGRKERKSGIRSECKLCTKAISAIRCQRDKLKIKQSAKKSREKYPEKIKQRMQKWRQANRIHVKTYKNAYRTQYPQQHREEVRRWKIRNPDKVREQNLRRQSQKKQVAIHDFTVAQWQIVKATYNPRCVYCGKKPKRLTMDHIIPLSKGGQHTLNNIVPACRSCNSTKHTKPPLCPVQPMLIA